MLTRSIRPMISVMVKHQPAAAASLLLPTLLPSSSRPLPSSVRTVSTSGTLFKDAEVIDDDNYKTGKSGKRVKVKKRASGAGAAAFPKVYTKTGDGGRSSLFTGERRSKSDAVFEALGSTDELSSHLGVCREYALDSKNTCTHPIVDQLMRIQCLLQDVGSCVATPKSSARQTHIDRVHGGLSKRHTLEIEEWIDEYSELLPPLENFILPGGGKTSAGLHVARSVCRRAERRIAPLVEEGEVDQEVIKYVNRLSDFLFVAARLAAKLDAKEETIYSRPPPPDAIENAYAPKASVGVDVWKRSGTKDNK